VQRVFPSFVTEAALVAVRRYQKPDYQALRYHSAPKKKKTVGSLDEIDPEMRAAWDKLGIPIGEQVLVSL
jgi:Fe-S cluster assembly protein SufB